MNHLIDYKILYSDAQLPKYDPKDVLGTLGATLDAIYPGAVERIVRYEGPVFNAQLSDEQGPFIVLREEMLAEDAKASMLSKLQEVGIEAKFDQKEVVTRPNKSITQFILRVGTGKNIDNPDFTRAVHAFVDGHKTDLVQRYKESDIILTNPNGTAMDPDQVAGVIFRRRRKLQERNNDKIDELKELASDYGISDWEITAALEGNSQNIRRDSDGTSANRGGSSKDVWNEEGIGGSFSMLGATLDVLYPGVIQQATYRGFPVLATHGFDDKGNYMALDKDRLSEEAKEGMLRTLRGAGINAEFEPIERESFGERISHFGLRIDKEQPDFDENVSRFMDVNREAILERHGHIDLVIEKPDGSALDHGQAIRVISGKRRRLDENMKMQNDQLDALAGQFGVTNRERALSSRSDRGIGGV